MKYEIIYLIDKYKFGALCMYVIAISTILSPLLHIYQLTQQERFATASIYVPPSYPLLHNANAHAISSSANATIWPIHGTITTEFGVGHQPWQATHTGIDISSGKPSGASPITTWKSGIVYQVAHGSSNGFGNYVIVDHGEGLSSLYGHMASTTVTVGQTVVPGDTLGYEGSTGHSTGPHLHFELRLNNKPVNPHKYLPGRP